MSQLNCLDIDGHLVDSESHTSLNKTVPAKRKEHIQPFLRPTMNARKTDSNRGNSRSQSKWSVSMRCPMKIGRKQEVPQLFGEANAKP